MGARARSVAGPSGAAASLGAGALRTRTEMPFNFASPPLVGWRLRKQLGALLLRKIAVRHSHPPQDCVRFPYRTTNGKPYTGMGCGGGWSEEAFTYMLDKKGA